MSKERKSRDCCSSVACIHCHTSSFPSCQAPSKNSQLLVLRCPQKHISLRAWACHNSLLLFIHHQLTHFSSKENLYLKSILWSIFPLCLLTMMIFPTNFCFPSFNKPSFFSCKLNYQFPGSTSLLLFQLKFTFLKRVTLLMHNNLDCYFTKQIRTSLFPPEIIQLVNGTVTLSVSMPSCW